MDVAARHRADDCRKLGALATKGREQDHQLAIRLLAESRFAALQRRLRARAEPERVAPASGAVPPLRRPQRLAMMSRYMMGRHIGAVDVGGQRSHVALRAALGARLALVHLGRKLEGAERLVGRRLLGVDVDKHERLAVAAEAGLQQVRQLGVAVRDVTGLGGQRRKDVAQRAQGLVDGARLFLPRALHLGAGQTLAPRKVNEVERASEADARIGVHAGAVEHEDGVGAGRGGVHGGRLNSAAAFRAPHDLVRPLHGFHRKPHRTRDVRVAAAGTGVLDAQAAGWGLSLPAVGQQVADALVVNLHEGGLQAVVPPLRRQLLDGAQQLVHGSRDDAARLGPGAALHRVRLPRARLAVAEKADVVAVQRALYQLAHLLEHRGLRGTRCEYFVESKRRGLAGAARRRHAH
mmetsp:Transcript_2081/g.5119  ORF Transcript_2081/g.5119 Transcript_2081/m.5119 type:complete len:407 (-) Transcript_2081:809-2029(-)